MKQLYNYGMIFKALGDDTRLKILEMLSCGELCACDLLESFDITQPTLSYHMKILQECGLITSRKEGAWTKYDVDTDVLLAIQGFWNRIVTEQEVCICKTVTNKKM